MLSYKDNDKLIIITKSYEIIVFKLILLNNQYKLLL